MKKLVFVLLCLFLVSCSDESFEDYFQRERRLSVTFSDALGEIDGVLWVGESIFFYPDGMEGVELKILKDSVVAKFGDITLDPTSLSRLGVLSGIRNGKTEGKKHPTRISGDGYEIIIKEELSLNEKS